MADLGPVVTTLSTDDGLAGHPVLHFFSNNPLGDAMRAVWWLYPAGQVLHFFGLCFLIGALLIVDLRLMGFLRRLPIRVALTLVPVALVAFAVNALTGLAFFTSDPARFWFNIAFRLKFAAIVLAGLNAAWFTFAEQRKALALADGADTGWMTRTTAGLSILLWFGVIVLGRLLPVYTP